MKTYAIINQKGGVGKSTTALSIGAGLISKGFSVLFIDLDAQGNLSYTVGADTAKGYNSLGILQRPETAPQEIQTTTQGDIIASTPALSGADMILTDVGKEYKLKEALTAFKSNYDYCIIDTPPTLGIVTINALTACDKVIIPAQADVYSLQGISQLNNTVQTVKKYCNPALEVAGIVLTRYNNRAIIKREVAGILESTAEQLDTKLYKSYIRECTAVIESQATRNNIFSYAPKSNAAQDYAALINEILEDEKE